MKWKFDIHKRDRHEFGIENLVWVNGTHYNTDCPSQKLFFKRAGPFPIIRKVSNTAYKLKIPATWKNIYLIINEAFLKLYIWPTFQQ